MRCASGHQCNLYPYGGFFAKAAACDRFVIVDTTQYVKKEFHNRNKVKLSSGREHWLSIPVTTAGRFTQALNEVEIKPGAPWRKGHMRTLELNYGKCPHFEEYYAPLKELLLRDWRKLAAFTVAVIRLCLRQLGVATPVTCSSELGATGKRTELILDICRRIGCDAYLHGKHGRDYVDFPYLTDAGIRNLVQAFTPVSYVQPWGPFVGNLSVLDVLYNCGPESLAVLLAGNRIHDAETAAEVTR